MGRNEANNQTFVGFLGRGRARCIMLIKDKWQQLGYLRAQALLHYLDLLGENAKGIQNFCTVNPGCQKTLWLS